MDWMKNAWDWTSNLLGDTDMGDLIDGRHWKGSRISKSIRKN